VPSPFGKRAPSTCVVRVLSASLTLRYRLVVIRCYIGTGGGDGGGGFRPAARGEHLCVSPAGVEAKAAAGINAERLFDVTPDSRPEKMMQRSSRNDVEYGRGVTLVATMTMRGDARRR
jgi:hypothetical protein